MSNNNKGFTLIELLVVVSLLGIVSMAVYGVFSGGVSLSRKLLSQRTKIEFFLDWRRLQKDLRRQITYRSIPFAGLEEEISLPSLVTVQGVQEGELPRREVGRIRYYRPPSRGVLCREIMTYAELIAGTEKDCRPVFSSFPEFVFQYYGQTGKGRGLASWHDTWDKDYLPLAVRLKIKMEDGIEKPLTTLLP